MDLAQGQLVLTWGWLTRWWWLHLVLTFLSHVTAKMPTSDQVFNFFPQLDAVICLVSMIPMELTVFGVVSFCWV